jgi:hypothetical protein
MLDACDLRVDVGMRNDPATGDFDHHRRVADAVRALAGAALLSRVLAVAKIRPLWANVADGRCRRSRGSSAGSATAGTCPSPDAVR